jgi:hypothetical protein
MDHLDTWVVNVRKVDSFLGAELELGARLLAFDAEKLVLALPESTWHEVAPGEALCWSRSCAAARGTVAAARADALPRARRQPGRRDDLRPPSAASRTSIARPASQAKQDPAVMTAVQVLGARIERVIAR